MRQYFLIFSLLLSLTYCDDKQKTLDNAIANLRTRNYLLRVNSIKVIGGFGLKALPILYKQFFYEKALIPQYIEAYLVQQEIIRQFRRIGHADDRVVDLLKNIVKEDDDFLVKEAILALGELGKKAPRIIFFLIKVLDDRWGELAAQSLAKIGEKAIRPLGKVVRFSDTPEARCAAVNALGDIDSIKHPMLRYLMDASRHDPNELVRVAAVHALGKKKHTLATYILLRLIQDEAQAVGLAACASLAKHGKLAVSQIMDTFDKNPPEQLRIKLYGILTVIGKEAAPAIATLNSRLSSSSQKEFQAIIEALISIGYHKKSQQTIKRLIFVVYEQKNSQTLSLITSALQSYAPQSLPHVLPLLKSKRPQVVKVAVQVLESHFVDAIQLLQDQITKQKNPVFIANALKILAQDENSLPILIEHLQHENLLVCYTAKNMIIQHFSKSAFELLMKRIENLTNHIKALKSNQDKLQKSKVIVDTFVDLGEKAKIALMNLAVHESPSLRHMAVDAIAQSNSFFVEEKIAIFQAAIQVRRGTEQFVITNHLANLGEPAMEAILELLTSKELSVRECAIIALTKMRTPRAAWNLIWCLDNKQNTSFVIKALCAMHDVAMPILKKAISHEEPHVRFVCVVVLSKIESQESIGVLRKHSDVETHPMIRYVLEKALQQKGD
ncbi:HEAT repeat domain-containing protein [Candidatus Uabimicrobium amorphum]|uniref:HEAT repeat domain-containing protein n=1 Tax=Uabimicrobium amorphum TaxID=2596890 RepID=A0A5S9IRE2_UABAM|nr:HEAT repeat domain-containing protein [Candidatus Uabimicrobium amorphum]BBM86337.1 hypothetical protein UABAM_04723 [Candidatus Uabimicrobium amorphum]